MSGQHRGERALISHSPLESLHIESGAHLTDFSGWRLPLRFTSTLEEHRVVRESCGVFDISHMGQLVVAGSDAGTALSRALVSDVTTLPPGAARYTMICSESGGVLDDLIVYRLAPEQFLVVANAANTDVVLRELDSRFAGRAAKVEDTTAGRALLAVQGPRAVEVITSCVSRGVALPSRFHFTHCEIAGQPVLLARTGYTGEDGFELSVDRTGAEALWRRLLHSPSAADVLPVGLAARDTLRLEAGLPLYGHELSAERSPFEAGLGWTVDLAHDFVGAAALRRIDETTTAECLVGLVGEGRRVPRQGFSVAGLDGRRVGEVTSGAPSPTLGTPIAMAYVLRSASSPGTALDIDVRGRMERAEVVTLPFWHRPRPARQ